MAIIHQTTLVPAKLELLAGWLPAQPWYRQSGPAPDLARIGGFRLDDPAGEVGIEFLAVADGSGEQVTTYQVPLTYRASACAEAEAGLLGTAEHGVLGRRWIYDGVRDPVLVAQLVALIQNAAEAQAQRASNTPDRAVVSRPVTSGHLTVTGSAVAADGPHGTDLRIKTASADGTPGDDLLVRVHRILLPESGADPGAGGPAWVAAPWRQPDGTQAHGIWATARPYPARAAG
jgi:maltokinase-like protein